jgi:putative sterol carrier protein
MKGVVQLWSDAMSRFATEQEVYDDLGKILASAAADESLSARLKETDAVVQYRVSEPTATLTLDARKKSSATVELGETKLEPEIVFALEADVAHDLLNGKLNLTSALASGAIATKGPVTKVLRLLPVTLELSEATDAEPAAPAVADVIPEADAESSTDEPSDSSEEPAAEPETAEPAAEPSPE